MLESIASAQHPYSVGKLHFSDDEVRRLFAEALIEHAQVGVDVRVQPPQPVPYFWHYVVWCVIFAITMCSYADFTAGVGVAHIRYNRRNYRKLSRIQSQQNSTWMVRAALCNLKKGHQWCVIQMGWRGFFCL
ncbi:MAG: hypothetical protein GXP17_11650 [Gammaproteobacteria bacterium]|nr:hypothetical protein [Gammaproteobacteria bacterium]